MKKTQLILAGFLLLATTCWGGVIGPQSVKETFNGTTSNGWKVSSGGEITSVADGVLNVKMAKQENDKYRADLQYQTSGTFTFDKTKDIVWAVKLTAALPGTSNYRKFEINYKNATGTDIWINGISGPSGDINCNDGGKIYYFNLGASELNKLGGVQDGTVIINKIHFIFSDADIDNAENAHYSVDWVATFTSVEDLQAFQDWTDEQNDPTLPYYEVCYRPQKDGSGWQKGPFVGFKDTEFEGNYNACFFAIEYFLVENLSVEKIYTLSLTTTGSNYAALSVWDFPYQVHSKCTAADMINYATGIVGIAPGSIEGTTNDPITSASCQNNVWSFEIPATALTPIATIDGKTLVGLFLTSQNLTTSSSAKYATCAHSEKAHPSFTQTGSAAIMNSTQGKQEPTLQSAITNAQAEDMIDILEDITVNAQIKPTVNLTINGNGHRIINGGLTNANFIQSNTCDFTFKNVIIDGNNVNSSKNLVESGTSGQKITLQNVTIQNVNTTEGKGILVVKTGGVLVLDTVIMKNNTAAYDVFDGNNLTLNNVFATDGKGIYTEQKKINTNYLITCTPSDWESTARINNNILPQTPVALTFKENTHDVASGIQDDRCFVLSKTDQSNGWFLYASGSTLKLTKETTNAVAQVGERYYGSIASAFYSSVAESEIVVLKNTAIYAPIACNKKMTIDGGNYTITNPNNDILFWRFAESADLTLKNATFDGQNAATENYYLVSNEKNTILTLQNVQLQNIASSQAQGIICNKGLGTLVLDNVSFTNCSNTSYNEGLVFIGTIKTTLRNNLSFTNCTGSGFYIDGTNRLNADNTFKATEAIKVQFQPNTRPEGTLFVKGCSEPSWFTITNTEQPYPIYAGNEGLYTGRFIQNTTRTPVVDYTDLATAVSEANAGEVITIYQNTTISGSCLEIKRALTIQGATGQEKIICGVPANTFMILADGNEANYTVTFKNLIVDGQNKTRSTQTFDTNNRAKMCFDGVSVINTNYSVVTGDVKCNGDGITLTGNNSFATGIYLNKTKRVTTTNATHTEPIPLILAWDYKEDYAIVLTCTNPDLFTVSDQNGNDWYLYISNKELKGKKYKSAITLDESLLTNEDTLALYNGRTVNITLARTIAGSATDYSTLCLPFETTQDELGAAEVLAYDHATVIDDEATLTFTSVTDLEAGKPYLVRFASAKENPVFAGKTITAATPGKYGDNHYEFVGLFSQTKITETATHSMMYLGSANTLYWAGANCTIKGSRGYLKAVSAPAKAARRVALYNAEAQSPTGNSSLHHSINSSFKMIRDGQLVIIREGTTYNAQGQIIH